MKIGFVGAGKMAQALVRGMVGSGKFAPENIMASSPASAQNFLKQINSHGVQTTNDNAEIAKNNDVIFLAVKPPLIRTVVSEIAPAVNRQKLIISIALGITIETVESLLPTKSRVVRVMPNTPAVVRAGASGCVKFEYDPTVNDLLGTVGYAVEVDESLVDPITGLSACGPAYMFCAIEALADGGVKMGLERDMAVQLAAHTLLGAAKMVLETGHHPAQLKDDIQSPAGSSIYGMHHLEKSAFRGTLMDAVETASKRSRETGEGAGKMNPFKRHLDLRNAK